MMITEWPEPGLPELACVASLVVAVAVIWWVGVLIALGMRGLLWLGETIVDWWERE